MDFMGLLALIPQLTLTDVQQWLDIVRNLLTIAAIIVGGIWAYFNFIRGRFFVPRLEPRVSGQVTSQGDMNYLLVTAEAENVGVSKFENTKETTLFVKWCEIEEGVTIPESIWWQEFPQTPPPAWALFEAHEWIEPGETIEDKRLIAIPGQNYFAFHLTLVVKAKSRRLLSTVPPFVFRQKVKWETTDVVYFTKKQRDNKAGSEEQLTRKEDDGE